MNVANLPPIKVHVLFESSNGAEPHGCSLIRLLLPLTHPSVANDIILTFDSKIPDVPVDVVIIERLWVHEFNYLQLLETLASLKSQGTTIIYETDDDLLEVNTRVGDRPWPSIDQKNIIRLFARESHGVIVSTENLALSFNTLNQVIKVVPNALDERLFTRQKTLPTKEKIKFGYMGTFTHLEDLIYIAPAIKSALRKHIGNVEFEIVGIGDENTIRSIFGDLPVTIKRVPEKEVAYDKFCAWMSRNIDWDFGIAPLLESNFSKSKSDIKFLDYGLMGIPGIFSEVPAYQNTVEHEKTGLICKNTVSAWEEALTRLISSNDLRTTLADGAYTYTMNYRTLTHRAKDFVSAIQAIRSTH